MKLFTVIYIFSYKTLRDELTAASMETIQGQRETACYHHRGCEEQPNNRPGRRHALPTPGHGEQQGKERNIPDSQECQTAGSGHHVSLCEHVHQEFTDSAVINEPLNNEQNQ